MKKVSRSHLGTNQNFSSEFFKSMEVKSPSPNISFSNTKLLDIIIYHLPVDIFGWIFTVIFVILCLPLVIAGAIILGYAERNSKQFQEGILILVIGVVVGIIVLFVALLWSVFIYLKRKSSQ